MKHAQSVLLAAILASSACTGPIPGVPPVEFRLNSPAQPTTVNDNHQETHHQETHTTTVQVVQPVLVSYSAAAAAPASSPAPTVPAPSSPPMATFLSPAPATRAEPWLDRLAIVEAPGMRPLGPAMGAQFHEGQAFELPLPLEPGRCYSIVGAGVGISELDLALVLWSPSSPSGVVAHRRSAASTSSHGAGCYLHSISAAWPGKIVVRAARGSGLGVARVYVD